MHLWVLGAVVAIMHTLVAYDVQKVGLGYYTTPRATPFDVGHAIVPDHSTDAALHAFHATVITLAPFVLVGIAGAWNAFLPMLIVAFALRALVMGLTILPPHPGCTSQKFTWYEAIVGHCHDKIPSGHFINATLAAVVLVSAGAMGWTAAVGFVVATAWTILALRHHYTADLAVAALITAYVSATTATPTT